MGKGPAAPSLPATDEAEQQAAWRKAGKRPHRSIDGAWNDDAAALLEAAIAVSRHSLGGAREKPRKELAGDARTRLKLSRHRTRTKHGHPHAVGFKLAMQRLAEREYISFACVIHAIPGPGMNAAIEATLRIPPR
jgi:hypothetical protein